MVHEKAVHATRAAIYEFDKSSQTWQSASNPPTLVDVFVLYSREGRYRIIGRAPNNEGWDLNAAIYPSLTLQQVSGFFVQWQDHLRVHGLAFADDSHQQHFCQVVSVCESNARLHPVQQHPTSLSPAPSPRSSSPRSSPRSSLLGGGLGRSSGSLPGSTSPAAPRSNDGLIPRRMTSSNLPVPSLSSLTTDSSSSSSSGVPAAPGSSGGSGSGIGGGSGSSGSGTLGRAAAAKLGSKLGSDDKDEPAKKGKKGGRSLFRPVSVMMSSSNMREQMNSKQLSSKEFKAMYSSGAPAAPSSTPLPAGDGDAASSSSSSSSVEQTGGSSTTRADGGIESILSSKPPPAASRRDYAAIEIYTTEISYVKSLNAIVDALVPSFMTLGLGSEYNSILFCNIKQIRILNSQFLMHIHPHIQAWNNENTTIADAFKVLIDYSKAYVQYYQNYESVPPTIEVLKKQKPFAKWLASAEVEVLTGGQGLLQLLIQPCQRFMRYNLLLAELLKQTPETHPDFAGLKHASERISQATNTINAKVETQQMQHKLDEIRKGKDFVGFEQLMSTGRMIRHFTPCTIQLGTTEYTWMSLWDDCIAFASDAVDKRNQTKKKYEEHIILENAWMESGAGDTVLEITTPTDFFMVTVISRAEKAKWLDVFEQAVDKRISQISSVTRLSDKRRHFAFQFPEGTYTGEWENGKTDGSGSIDYKSGAAYQGVFVRGKRHGEGHMSFENKSFYQGEWELDLPHGQGVLDIPSVGSYTGGWEKGRKHGQGKMTWVNGDVYEGQWHGDAMSGGAGVLTLANGFVYEGEFLNNAFHGQGKLTSFGNTYVGQWVGDRKEGSGVMEYASGARYEGEWKNDFRHGKGTYTTKEEKLRYEGEWDDDMMHGQGHLVLQQNCTYVGAFSKDAKSGQGTWTHVDGSTYTGSWLDDKREGEGESTDAFGSSYSGHWHSDRRIGKGTEKYPDGSVYQGDFYRDRKHGSGKMTFADGSIYAGEWNDDRRHGKGTFRFGNNVSYSGDWENGLRHGAGKWKDGSGEYEGQWKTDFRDGTGQFKNEREKTLIAGIWKNDIPDGRATLTRNDGSQTEIAFSDGKIDRPLLSEIAPCLPFTRMSFR